MGRRKSEKRRFTNVSANEKVKKIRRLNWIKDTGFVQLTTKKPKSPVHARKMSPTVR